MPSKQPAHALLLLLFLLSGAAALVYELVWTRELIFVFGGTTYAITTVLVAFMGGLGLGSYLIGRVADNLERPARIYGVLEILIGLYALAVPASLSAAEPLYRSLYPSAVDSPWQLTGLRFVLGAGVLLIPTTMMGATLPLLVRYVTLRGGSFGAGVALLYGTNTIGAVLGVLATGFLLIPTLGLRNTTLCAALANVAIGTIAITFFGGRPQPADKPRFRRAAKPAAPEAAPRTHRVAALVALAVSGFAAMVYQVSWTRALVLSIGSSTYSFTCILAAFVFGLGAGSLIVSRWVDRWRAPLRAIALAQLAISGVALLMLPIYGRLPNLIYSLARTYGREQQAFERLLAVEFAIIIAVTIVPTLLMGAMFPLATRAAIRGARDESAATGRAYGVNTLGTIAGSFLAGFVLLRYTGAMNAVIIASLLSAACGAGLWYVLRAGRTNALRRWAPSAVTMLVAVAAAKAVQVFGRWDPMLLASAAFLAEESPRVLAGRYAPIYHADGVDLSVTVGQRRDDPSQIILTVNGKTDASTNYPDMTTQMLIAHVPALLAPKLENSCVIGLGCGMTLSSLARHPKAARIDLVEISEEVIRAARAFGDYNDHVLDDTQRVRIIRADGRNHLLLTGASYDLIVSEPSNPWIAGVSNLFTREFFELCAQRLKPDGLLCAWLHSYSMSPENFRMVVRTLADVFEFVAVWEMNEADFALIASHQPIRAPLDRVLRRFHEPAVRADLYRVGLGRPEKIIGRCITSGEPLRRWAEGAPLHTDDNSILEFSAPRHLFSRGWLTTYRELMSLSRSPFDEVIAADPTVSHQAAELMRRVENVRRSRRLRLEARERRGDDLAVLDLLLRAYELDPGDRELFEDLHEFPNWDSPQFLQSKLGGELAARFRSLPVPLVSDKRGMSLPDFAEFLATTASSLPPADAVYYLREAVEIAPELPHVREALIVATAKSGDVRHATELLDQAISDGVLTPEAIRKSRPLAETFGRDVLERLLGGR